MPTQLARSNPLPTTSEAVTSSTSTCTNNNPPEEFIALVMGPCSCWHTIVISVFCLQMVLFGFNEALHNLLVPKYVEFYCKEENGTVRSKPNQCVNSKGTSCQKFIFSKPYQHTIISEFHLVCQHKQNAVIYNLAFTSGLAVGYLLYGWAGDNFGRKNSMIMSAILQSILGPLSSSTDKYMLRLMVNFLYACSIPGTMLLVIILTCDLSSNKSRTLNLGLLCTSIGLGYALLPYISKLLVKNSLTTICVSVSQLFVILFISIIRESPTWLLYKNKTYQAENALLTVARFNGYQLPSTLRIRPLQIINLDTYGEGTIYSMFKSNTMKNTVGLYTLWLSICSLTAFDITRNWSKLKNRHFTLTVFGIVYVISGILSLIMCYTVRHKLALILAAIANCIIAITLRTILTKNAESSTETSMLILELAHYGCYILMLFILLNATPRMLPTEFRCLGTGLGLAIGKLSVVLSHVFLAYVSLTLPVYITIMIVITIIIIICTLLIYDVHNRELPDLIEDSLHFNKKFKPTRWSALTSKTPTIDENEIKFVDFERETSLSIIYPKPVPVRFYKNKNKATQS